MMGGFNPLKDWWKPSGYTKPWYIIFGIPIVGLIFIYALFVNTMDAILDVFDRD